MGSVNQNFRNGKKTLAPGLNIIEFKINDTLLPYPGTEYEVIITNMGASNLDFAGMIKNKEDWRIVNNDTIDCEITWITKYNFEI